MQILPWVKMGHFCTTSFAKEKKLRHQNITHIIPISHRVAINHLISFFPAIFCIRCLSDVRCLSCILNFILYFFRDKVPEMNPSLPPSAKWFLPSDAFIHKLRKHAKLLLQCWLHGFTKTFLCKLATFIVNICRDGSPGVLVKDGKNVFFVSESINFVWVKMHYNLFFWPVSHNLNDNIQSTNRTAQWA